MTHRTARRRSDYEKITIYVEPDFKADLQLLARHNQRTDAAEGRMALMRHLTANRDELDKAKAENGEQVKS